MTVLKQDKERDFSSHSWYGQKALNPVREIVESPRIKKLIDATKDPNKPLIPLSIGDPTVFGNLETTKVFTEAIKRAAEDVTNHGYKPSVGILSTRKAVAKHYSYVNNALTADDVLLASGCSGALEILFKALLNPRQAKNPTKILLPSPGFPLYGTLLNAYDIPFDKYHLLEKQQWEVDLEELERKLQEDRSIVAILLTNPSNPTGAVYSQTHLQDILRVAQKWGIVIVADEIYGDLCFSPNKFHPIASLTSANLDVPIVSVGGIAKEFLTPGFRIGWILFYSGVRTSLVKVQESAKRLSMLILGPNSLVQAAIPSLFDEVNREKVSQFKADLVKKLKDNADYLFERLSCIEDKFGDKAFKINRSQGSMYLFVKILSSKARNAKRMRSGKFHGDSIEFMERLLEEEQVFVLAGKVFGENVPDMFRLTLTPPRKVLKDACNRIEQFVKNNF